MDHTPLHETKIHGSITFPYNIYRESYPNGSVPSPCTGMTILN